MVDKKEMSIPQGIVDLYRSLVQRTHPDLATAWPILSGYNSKIGSYKGWLIAMLSHTGTHSTAFNDIGEFSHGLVGVPAIDPSNREAVRSRLARHFNFKESDAIVFVDPAGNLLDEMSLMLQRHEFAMGITPMRIFLSHKGADKPLVREFKRTLEALGFDPWLDEDAMHAGTELERGLRQGFADSCAAVFFVTPNFTDENFLASEVDYAIQEKREKRDRFAIITLVFHDGSQKAKVPELLTRYVWKEPASQLEALTEVLRALPITVGNVYWKSP